MALTVKALILASTRYSKLRPSDIARLNNIKLINPHVTAQQKYFQKMFQHYHGGFQSRMNQIEAFQILGISGKDILNLTPEMLKARHRKMMIQNHPDRGGSPYIAMKINTAKDLLQKTFMFKK
ncbi:hypothetical protein HII13_003127 [Brettanomyces bruxellensis]|nr:uncharacterized protein BRETT_000979 [Brettanomyces bruxellensis]KAF6010353.1 hypothetical protein HII13_003127 [Brettanomyces bruxellensis]KAF6014790.1 hypothetical protein HII12_001207 [Brettanomyces bruxellensis]QOU21258.1 hypothetical protein BRETT_000979 [Brettanomyces bruxellensis]